MLLGGVRIVKPIHTVALIILLSGCSQSQRTVTTTHSGDIGQFILQSVANHGGHATTTNGLPALQSQWRTELLTGAVYLKGSEQVAIVIPGDHFQHVTGFLAQDFVAPSQPATLNTIDVIQGWYAMGDFGFGLQFYRDQIQ